MSNPDPTTAERTLRHEEKKRKEGFERVPIWIINNPSAIQKVRDCAKQVNEEFKSENNLENSS